MHAYPLAGSLTPRPRARPARSSKHKWQVDLKIDGVEELVSGIVTKCDAPKVTIVTPGGQRVPSSAADDDLPSITFTCNKGILLEPQVVIKLRSLKANTPVVANAADRTLKFTLAAPLSVTVAASRTVATTRTLTLHMKPLSKSNAFEKLSEWLDGCGYYYGVGGTDAGRRGPAAPSPIPMPALESPSPARAATRAGRASPAEVVESSPAATGLPDLEQRLVALDQTEFDEMLIRVLLLRIRSRQ